MSHVAVLEDAPVLTNRTSAQRSEPQVKTNVVAVVIPRRMSVQVLLQKVVLLRKRPTHANNGQPGCFRKQTKLFRKIKTRYLGITQRAFVLHNFPFLVFWFFFSSISFPYPPCFRFTFILFGVVFLLVVLFLYLFFLLLVLL